jgi:hypothetical protein
MKLFAVSYIDWGSNELVTEFHQAEGWKEALRQHSAYANPAYTKDNDTWFADMPDDLEAAKQYAFGGDCMFEAVEVPLYNYITETIAWFKRDPADDEYQRGFLAALRVCITKGCR